MFQKAGSLRYQLFAMRGPLGVRTLKSSMPCLASVVPVAIEVHTTGDQ